MDYVDYWHEKTGHSRQQIVRWAGLHRSRYYEWVGRYGMDNLHNGLMPRDYWLAPEEKRAILDFHYHNPLNGYRRLAFMMIDENVVAVSPKTVYRVLKEGGVMSRKSGKKSKKGTGFKQPERPHEDWHIDVTYINICGTFYYLCSILDGYSRYIVHWDIREAMKESDVELIVQRALENHPDVKPKLISDNGPQFIARDFKSFIRLSGMDHVRTSPYYPQSNGKIERWHKELKQDCIRPKSISTLEEARSRVAGFVDQYNNRRLHAAIGYVTPRDKMLGHEDEIFKARDEKLERAREMRKRRWQEIRTNQQNGTEEPAA